MTYSGENKIAYTQISEPKKLLAQAYIRFYAPLNLILSSLLQFIADKSLAAPLRELRRLVQLRLGDLRDLAGYDLAALKIVGRLASDRKLQFIQSDTPKDVWAGLGLGSDVAAALEGRPRKKT